MKIANIIAMALLAGFCYSAAASTTKPEVFQIKIKADLKKLVEDPDHPGVKIPTHAPGVATETASVTLDKCQFYSEANHCSGFWNKTLVIENKTVTYWVGVFNSDKSKKHAVTLTICLTGEADIAQCTRTVASEVDFNGTRVPDISIYNNHYDEDPFFQPVLSIGQNLK
jgi:hypothetical protein